jgi:hypothetical protein
MNNQRITISTFILKTNHDNYPENKTKKIVLKNKIGEGAYGVVYEIESPPNQKHVIKIFKRPTSDKLVLKESNQLIPLQNENREILFYYKYITKKCENNYIISVYSIGILKNQFNSGKITIDKNNYFIILPLCVPFYKIFDIYNKPLINEPNGFIFTIKIMNRLLEASNYLEKTHQLVNLDLKINNFMFPLNSRNLNDVVMLDFSIIKKKYRDKNENIYSINQSYYIWPEPPILLDHIPSYSICINGFELLFGHKNISKISDSNNKHTLHKISKFLKIIKEKDHNKNNDIYNIFYNGLIVKVTTVELLLLINKFLKNN